MWGKSKREEGDRKKRGRQQKAKHTHTQTLTIPIKTASNLNLLGNFSPVATTAFILTSLLRIHSINTEDTILTHKIFYTYM